MRLISTRLTFAALVALTTMLAGCASGLPAIEATSVSQQANALLARSMQAHGGAAFDAVRDISVGYRGEWNGIAARTQPVLIDRAFRGGSEERLLLGTSPVVAQRHTGPGGVKLVERTPDSIAVRYNGTPETRSEPLAAAALVADAYRMFLTGPFYFRSGNAVLALAGEGKVDGHLCDLLLAVRRPGHGLSKEDRYLLFIDRQSGLLRRVRFSMNGLESTQGAVVEVDLLDHASLGGVQWPTHFIERIRKPIPFLPVHEWTTTGLELNRGFTRADIAGGVFSGSAERVAPALPNNRQEGR